MQTEVRLYTLIYMVYMEGCQRILKNAKFCHHKNHKNERNPLISISSK